jgi:hypothetical protein
MTHAVRIRALFVSPLLAASLALAQSAAPAPQTAPASQSTSQAAPGSPAPEAAPQPSTSAPAPTGGTIRGIVKDGNIPLPGVSVTASNSLTGKRYSTTTDITGAYTLVIPQNGRYVVRTDFPAFATVTKEALLNTSSHQLSVDFSVMLASRAVQQEQQQSIASVARQYLGSGAQNLNLLGAATDLIQAGAGGEDSGAALPSLAGNSDFNSGESVAVTGQTGTTNPLAGIDFGQMREDAQLNQALNGGGPGGRSGGGFAGGGFGGGFAGGGGRGGRGGGGGFRGNFRNFKPNQPHGALFWSGGNGALNAEDFALRGQSFQEPSYYTNRFGATIMTPPYIPRLLTNDRNDMLFFTLSGTRSVSPFDEYGTVPTLAERGGDFSALTTQTGTPITIYNPGASTCTANGNTPGTPFVGNVVPASCLSSQAAKLLSYVPPPNLTGQTENYQRLASEGTNTTQLGFRYMHSFGGSSAGGGLMRMARQFLGQGNPTLTQSINANFNLSHSASDNLNLFPELGGKSQTHQYSLQAGYSIGKGHLTDNLTASWNDSKSQSTNYFSNLTDIAPQLGLTGLPHSPQLWGLPNVTLNQFSGLSERQPSFITQETIGLADMLIWNHGKHNVRFGADFRRVYYDMIGNTDSTGTYIFTGLFTEAPGSSGANGTGNTGIGGLARSGSSLADLLLGLPQETTLQAAYQESHLRENEIDGYAQDDWRAMKNLTFLVGLRYDYYSPYSEQHDRLATLDVSNDFLHAATVTPNGVGPYAGKYPRDLVYPEKNNFSPRLGFAAHPFTDTTIRGGYGINYTVGQYVKFVQNFAFEPPFADVQTNDLVAPTSADLAGVVRCTSFCLANGFPAPQIEGNYAVSRNYRLPYVQVWYLNVQRTLPWNVLLNVGYNGSKGTRLDVISAPGRYPQPDGSVLDPDVLYNYEQSVAFSNYNALSASARKRLSGGVSLQATYTYSHSIDDASSIGGNGGINCGANCTAQNWQDILAEESNSSDDVRNRVAGSFLYDLPFGPNTHLLTANWFGHVLANMNFSGSYSISSGNPLTPHYEATIADVSRGTTASLRPDRIPGVSLSAGGGKLDNWFNKDAFAAPSGVYGTASRYSIPGPGTIFVDMSASKSMRFGDTKNLELRATANNVFNTVQYSGVDSTLGSATYGEVISTAAMRNFTFMSRFRF